MRFFDHIGQRLQDLPFGVVDVAQRLDEKVVHRFDVLGKEAHVVPSFGRFWLLRPLPLRWKRAVRRPVPTRSRPQGRPETDSGVA
jgi:hypothetical protein